MAGTIDTGVVDDIVVSTQALGQNRIRGLVAGIVRNRIVLGAIRGRGIVAHIDTTVDIVTNIVIRNQAMVRNIQTDAFVICM